MSNHSTATTTTASLPQLQHDLCLADGGLETTLIFEEGLDLPDFASFHALESAQGREALRRYYEAYLDVAARDALPVLFDTATWRTSADWVARAGLAIEDVVRLNTAAVELLADLRAEHAQRVPELVISGSIGPRGDGYHPADLMSAAEARHYHALQARALADAGVDLVTAATMTHAGEAIGVVLAAVDAGVPVAISFTVETDGRLPCGDTLQAAIEQVDAATDGAPAYFMVNCAHPTHFAHVLASGQGWTERIRGIRANASTMSHEELDNAEELDRGDLVDLGQRYRALRVAQPQLTVLGGCCGTDHEHIGAISAACRTT